MDAPFLPKICIGFGRNPMHIWGKSYAYLTRILCIFESIGYQRITESIILMQPDTAAQRCKIISNRQYSKNDLFLNVDLHLD